MIEEDAEQSAIHRVLDEQEEQECVSSPEGHVQTQFYKSSAIYQRELLN